MHSLRLIFGSLGPDVAGSDEDAVRSSIDSIYFPHPSSPDQFSSGPAGSSVKDGEYLLVYAVHHPVHQWPRPWEEFWGRALGNPVAGEELVVGTGGFRGGDVLAVDGGEDVVYVHFLLRSCSLSEGRRR